MKLPRLVRLVLEEIRRERNWRRIHTSRVTGANDYQDGRNWQRHPEQQWRHQPTARNLSR